MTEQTAKTLPGGEGLGPDAASRILASLHEIEPTATEGGDDPPPQIHGYRTVRLLGRGGGGEVFLAYRDGSDRPVALKLLNRSLSMRSADSGRAWRELELLSQFRLAALPRIIDYGQHDGRLFIAAEFVDGLSLAEHCDRYSLDRRQRTQLLARVADAVHSLHERGIMHRDLKPANILVTDQGDPVIIDLGIAALLADDLMQTLTSDGAPIGSPAFMAPEQARGDRSQMSTRTDVYGLGATACYILTGKTPHDTATTLHSALHRIASEDPRHPSTLDPSLPRPLAAVLAKATAREPGDRYDSAAAFAADLRRWLAGEPVMAVSPGMWVRAARWVARRPVIGSGVASAAVALVILGATVASVWIINARPHRIYIEPDKSYAYLRSINDRELARWGTGRRGSVMFAELVTRPAEFGGGRLVLVSSQGSQDEGGTYGQLTAYATSDLSRPLWIIPGTAPELAAPPNNQWENEFHALNLNIADVFSESPGSEIIAIHGQGRSPHALRIYDLGGRILYEAWHLGMLGTPQWLPDSSLLIIAADRHGLSLNEMRRLGFALPEPSSWPKVVFAIQPEYETYYRQGWINGAPDHPLAPVRLAWYRYLTPIGQQPRTVQLFPSDRLMHPDTVTIDLDYGTPGAPATIRRLLGSDGNFVPGTEVISDAYRRRHRPDRPANRYGLKDAVEVCGLKVPGGRDVGAGEG